MTRHGNRSQTIHICLWVKVELPLRRISDLINISWLEQLRWTFYGKKQSCQTNGRRRNGTRRLNLHLAEHRQSTLRISSVSRGLNYLLNSLPDLKMPDDYQPQTVPI